MASKENQDKRQMVLKEIKPICKAFNYNYDYVFVDGSEYLVINGQKMCCTGNSMLAIRDELIGYIIINEYYRGHTWVLSKNVIKNIKQYWVY